MKSWIATGFALLALAVGCQYGPRVDRGRFESAALLQGGRTVVFTYHDLIYRPATGMAAFPDGGIPKYLVDRSYLCAYDRRSGVLRKLLEMKNREWTPRSGALHIVTARGDAVLVSQSGQRRDDLGTILTRHHALNLATGAHDTFDLAADLERHGRKPGPIYPADDHGTLVIITPAEGGSDDKEIWVRVMGGGYLRAGASSNYQDTVDGDVIYWNRSDREFHAFNVEKNETRKLAGYRHPAHDPVAEGASVGSGGSSVNFGVRTNGVWQYTPLPITPDAVRSL